ncbi:Uncharacterised protein [Mycobacteroides abscessus subsp. abscessus]|nr:Uncharacterised protein [Mycobacteroides abscessus subsp. abscessus]SKV88162.1 Uncharacterised protein [Mycobacteroides abscessus subsp. abscessus]
MSDRVCASSRGVPALRLNTTARPPNLRAERAGAFTRLMISISFTAHPIREQANDTLDMCGWTSTRCAPNSRVSVVPMPCSMGSPLAST